jgi:hypothetical protein
MTRQSSLKPTPTQAKENTMNRAIFLILAVSPFIWGLIQLAQMIPQP